MLIVLIISLLVAVEARNPVGALSGSPGMLLRDLLDTPPTDNSREIKSNPELAVPPPPANLEDIRRTLEDFGVEDRQFEKPSAQFLLDLYNRLQHGMALSEAVDVGDVQDADTIRSFEGADIPTYIGRSEVSLSFNLSTISTNEKPQLAELRIRPTRHQGAQQKKQKKKRLQKMRITLIQDGVKVKTLVYRVNSEEDEHDGSRVLDLSRVVRDIVDSGYRNCVVQVTVKFKKSKDKREKRSLPRHQNGILVVFSSDKHFFSELKQDMAELAEEKREEHSNIVKRSIKGKGLKKQRKRENEALLCNKKNFMVDFDLIGWGKWIVYPKKFNAYMCDGRCPLPVDQKYEPTNHAIMQSLMRMKSDDNVPRPCCVPTKLLPVSMLYYESGEIVVRHHEDMVVDTCGCR